jgi:hypothetical protein
MSCLLEGMKPFIRIAMHAFATRIAAIAAIAVVNELPG